MEVGTIQELIFTNPQWVISHPMHMHTNHMQIISYNAYTGPVAIDEGQTAVNDGLGEWTLYNQTGTKCVYQHERYNDTANLAWTPGLNLLFLGSDDASRRALSIGYHIIGDWVDSIQVPPLSNITVRFKADTFTGPTAIHCHTVIHQDRGQIIAVEIVDVGADLTANVTHNGTYAWSCMTNDPVGVPFTRSSASSILPSSVAVLLASLLFATFGRLLQ